MKKHDKITLGVLDKIDEDIIDEATDRKIRLSRSMGSAPNRKKLWTIGGIAASVILICSVVLIIFAVLNSNVPVYKGMTIKTATDMYMDSGEEYPKGLEPLGAKVTPKPRAKNGDNGNHYGLNKKIEDMVTIDVKTDEETRYYVRPGAKFIIQVHIDNPQDFEIQSFTLNGQKFANYMFKEGSSMELLLLEVKAPDEPGYIEYTIDAIKYIDGTEIKDVDMSKANKSIKAGVAYSNAPSATVSNEVVGDTDFSFTANITDANNLIGENKITAYLSDGESIVATKELTVGENNVRFDSLTRGKTYEYGICTAYDLVDGAGTLSHWLHTGYITTTTPEITLENVRLESNQITFDIAVNDRDNVTSIDKIELYRGNTLLKTAESINVRAFGDIATHDNYTIKITYTYQKGDGTTAQNVTEGYPTYSITYNTNGGTLAADTPTFTWVDLPLKLTYCTTETANIVFDGWYLDEDCTVPLNADTVTTLGDIEVYAKWGEATDGLLYSVYGDYATISGYNGNATEVIIPSRYNGLPITQIEAYAFYDKDRVVSVIMSDSVEIIHSYAFMNMDSLRSITFSNNLTVIGQGAFNYCRKLSSLVFPDSLTDIQAGAFSECDSLSFVTLGKNLTKIENNAFHNCSNLIQIYNKSSLNVTAGSSKYGYLAAYAVSVYTPESGDDGNVYIENDYIFCRSDNGDWYLNKYIGTESSLVLPATCKGESYYIAKKAFADNKTITSVVIPEGVTAVMGYSGYLNGAFFGCSNLQTVYLPSTLTIMEAPFQGCYKLSDVHYNGTVEQWNSILDPTWDIYSDTNSFDVHCTDGTV